MQFLEYEVKNKESLLFLHCSNGVVQPQNWKRAAVRAVQLQETRKQQQQHVDSNHVSKMTGNGRVRTGCATVAPIQDLPSPPPGPWNNNDQTYGIIGLESEPSANSSILVDMGKVVGVIKTHVPSEGESSKENDDEEEDDRISGPSQDSCSTCHGGARNIGANVGAAAVASAAGSAAAAAANVKLDSGETLDSSLCGDPLMYATFVAPVHQYSTETEPSSRQPSFNYSSRQPSFKHNSSSEAEMNPVDSQVQYQQNLTANFPALPVPSSTDEPQRFDDEVQDIYEKVPVDHWPIPPPPAPQQKPRRLQHHHAILVEEDNCATGLVEEFSQEDLDNQAAQERLSFISGSSNNEASDEGDDEEEHQDFPPLPPTPPVPPVNNSSLFRHSRTPDSVSSRSSYKRDSPGASQCQWVSVDEESDYGTIRRRMQMKRDRNRTTAFEGISSSGGDSSRRLSKSRSQSRSPGGEIDAKNRPGSSSAIVIVHHHHNCSARGASPDSISESSASFHENQMSHNKPPIFANRDSVRESWISSGGSDYQGSTTGSQKTADGSSSLRRVNECVRYSSPNSYSLGGNQRRSSSSVSGGNFRGGTPTTLSSRLRSSSSRDSGGSSSSVRGGGQQGSRVSLSTLGKQPQQVVTSEGKNVNAKLHCTIKHLENGIMQKG